MSNLDGYGTEREEFACASIKIIITGREITVSERNHGDFDRNPDGSVAESTIHALRAQFESWQNGR
ncbi:hypothetical protein HZA42_03740 [Candidatus Peregrinibacteria bacterium]|nr:hypothetical protein [Candidatus Peregrinibacteria bacterium]